MCCMLLVLYRQAENQSGIAAGQPKLELHRMGTMI